MSIAIKNVTNLCRLLVKRMKKYTVIDINKLLIELLMLSID